jgi:hypothetical protein
LQLGQANRARVWASESLRFLLALCALILVAPASASTVSSDISFTATKVRHDCIEAEGGYDNPGPGNCGYFRRLDFQTPYVSTVSLTEDYGGVRLGPDEVSGYIGINTRSLTAATLLLYSDVHNVLFDFDLVARTGTMRWTDDAGGFFGDGEFALSNVTFSEVPLPASLPMLLGGMLLLWSQRYRVSRRGDIRCLPAEAHKPDVSCQS